MAGAFLKAWHVAARLGFGHGAVNRPALLWSPGGFWLSWLAGQGLFWGGIAFYGWWMGLTRGVLMGFLAMWTSRSTYRLLLASEEEE